jgi:uncharacterized OsmC-like protein
VPDRAPAEAWAQARAAVGAGAVAAEVVAVVALAVVAVVGAVAEGDARMNGSHSFSVELEQREGFEFVVRFDWPGVPELVLDEPEPLGQRKGPNAARLVGAAVANCLAASLVFCLKNKFRQNPGAVRARATGRLERNEKGRYRIAGIDVLLSLAEKFGDMPHQERCLEQFEEFCIVTESIRRGIPVTVSVRDAAGQTLEPAAAHGQLDTLEA